MNLAEQVLSVIADAFLDSGAGKTTLLDVLAQRTSIGVITGNMFVNGQPRDASFQRKTGYVQQQGKSAAFSFSVILIA
jgi:ABC-type transport system involved in cytochrome bd biosynthesis fused ATPase/permease subunit